jgi:DNA-binding beta-propeller fold protein YncE
MFVTCSIDRTREAAHRGRRVTIVPRWMKVSIALALVIAATAGAPRAADGPISLVTAIQLPRVAGRIDHLAFDPRTKRLFVAALGNDSVEVLDTRTGTHVTSLSGFAEPQGIAVVPDARVVTVANRRNGQVQLLNADDFRPGPTLRPGRDADNVRYDAKANRLYVGYGSGGIAGIDPHDGKLIGQVAVAGHPESFQLDNADARIFVNVPDAGVVTVIDRAAMTVTTTFPVSAARACFPMSLDEANHRLFIGCRQPAKVVVLDTANGRVVTTLDTVQDADDLFYDVSRKRVYVSGGEGFLDVIMEPTPSTLTRMARVPTAPGARTSLFVADQNRFYLAIPARNGRQAEIRVYDVH